jgi:hypothetical protein
MRPDDGTDEKDVAAKDAALEQGVEPPRPGQDTTPPPASPLEDYLRELEQEFQDQQDEGKL